MYRETFTPTRAKDDPTDAEFAVDLLLRHPDRFKPLQPQSMEMRVLGTLVEQRRTMVDKKNRITNRLRSPLKHYYPQVLDWFDHIDTPIFCDFIRQWPTLMQVNLTRKNTLETFFHQHNMRFAQVLANRLDAIKTATPLTMDDAIIILYRLNGLFARLFLIKLACCLPRGRETRCTSQVL